MTKRQLLAAIVVGVLPMSFWMHKVDADEVPPGTITTVNVPDGQCHEDDPCWDCETMGNLICGPEVKPIVVQPTYNG